MSRLLDVHNFIGDKLRWQQQVLEDHNLSPAARVVGARLMHDLNVSRRGAWRSREAIAGLLGIHLKTVRRGMADLASNGHLAMTPSKGRGKSIVYEALIKEDILRPLDHEKGDKTSPNVPPRRGTISAEKGAANVPPYLDDKFNPPSSPHSGGGAHGVRRLADDGESEPLQGLAGRLVPVPQQITDECRALFGDPWCASYIDLCAFDPESQVIHAPGVTCRGRILEAVRPDRMRTWGVSMGDPVPAAQIQRALARVGGGG
jgi:hypothetical protein